MPEFARKSDGNSRAETGWVDARHRTRAMTPARLETGRSSGDCRGGGASIRPARAQCVHRYHGMTSKIIGPASPKSRQGKPTRHAQTYLSKRIKEGGQGVWGAIPMPPQAGLKESDADEIARWLAGGAK